MPHAGPSSTIKRAPRACNYREPVTAIYRSNLQRQWERLRQCKLPDGPRSWRPRATPPRRTSGNSISSQSTVCTLQPSMRAMMTSIILLRHARLVM